MVAPLLQVAGLAGVHVGKKLLKELAIHAVTDTILTQIKQRVSSPDGGSHTPEHQLQLILQELMGHGLDGTAAHAPKKKKSKYNRLVGKNMKLLTKSKNWKNKPAKIRFKRAVVLAQQEIKKDARKKK